MRGRLLPSLRRAGGVAGPSHVPSPRGTFPGLCPVRSFPPRGAANAPSAGPSAGTRAGIAGIGSLAPPLSRLGTFSLRALEAFFSPARVKPLAWGVKSGGLPRAVERWSTNLRMAQESCGGRGVIPAISHHKPLLSAFPVLIGPSAKAGLWETLRVQLGPGPRPSRGETGLAGAVL